MSHEIRLRAAAAVWALIIILPTGLQAQYDFDDPPINYRTSSPSDPVALLSRRLASGEASLEFIARRGYLDALLAALDVPASSQGLVYSKTSLQKNYISPATPRAIYFNDSVFIGWIPDAPLIEIISIDPVLGPIFYALRQQQASRPGIQRRGGDCLQCHVTAFARGAPGMMVRSVLTDRGGNPIFESGYRFTTPSSPFEERWGGWYVTGLHGGQRHRGNSVVAEREKFESLDLDAGANITDLAPRFETSRFRSPHSDIVALMVLEHQIPALNTIASAGYAARTALHRRALETRDANGPADALDPETAARLEEEADVLLRILLFANEISLEHPITGTSGFTEEFARRGRRDRRGRSLRDLDLKTRLFRHPLSYTIYSESFRRLPDPLKDIFYRKLWSVLTSAGQEDGFPRLSPADRIAIREILIDTQEDLPASWKTGSSPRPVKRF